MMFLSHLMIDVGSNPDRPRPGRRWLSNPYHVHQRLSMAFPSREKQTGDPLFLAPFDPAGFERARFLFRVDHGVGEDSPRAMVLVQSDLPPDWDYAFRNADMFLAPGVRPEVREYNPVFQPGQTLRFRIQANLSKKSPEHRTPSGKTDSAGRPRTQGKRVALTWEEDRSPDDAVREWFSAKGAPKGFDLGEFRMARLGWVSGFRAGRKPTEAEPACDRVQARMKFRSALLEGTLAVTDASVFGQTVASGIGSGKAFGFGLLSVAPARAGGE